MLLHSARDIETPGIDSYTGYGLLDSRAALEAVPGRFVEARISGVDVVQEAGATRVRVLGVADADGFSRAWIEIGQGAEPTSWKKVADKLSEPVRDGTLGAIPAKEFRGSSVWIVRLLVEHEDGTKREAWFTLNIGQPRRGSIP